MARDREALDLDAAAGEDALEALLPPPPPVPGPVLVVVGRVGVPAGGRGGGARVLGLQAEAAALEVEEGRAALLLAPPLRGWRFFRGRRRRRGRRRGRRLAGLRHRRPAGRDSGGGGGEAGTGQEVVVV